MYAKYPGSPLEGNAETLRCAQVTGCRICVRFLAGGAYIAQFALYANRRCKIAARLAMRHVYGLNHAHFLSASTYRRARLFDSDRFRGHFVQTLGHLYQQQKSRLLEWVLMPEHFHLLLWRSVQANPSQIVQVRKERTAKFALFRLRGNSAQPWYARMLDKVARRPTVHRPSTHRVWRRRFYDLNIRGERKRREKLNYMHGNLVKRGLVAPPELWPSSAFQSDHLKDASLLSMDLLP